MGKKTPTDVESEIRQLRTDLARHDHLYYVRAQPEITDREYDRMMERLKELESLHPDLITTDSPTQRVSGTPVGEFRAVDHSSPMLSLDNTYEPEEIRAWAARIRKALGNEPVRFVLNPKIDGVSLALRYEKGALTLAATRGDGAVGEDVTRNARTIRSIPLRLQPPAPGHIEIRGEVYMEIRDFRRMNEMLKEDGKEPFANPRNAASGSLRQKDSKITARRPLRFFAHSYAYTGETTFRRYTDFLEACERIGLPVARPFATADSVDDVIKIYDRWLGGRDRLSFEVDGVVVRVDALDQQRRLGTTAKAPRWAVACKFPSRQATTVLLDVLHSVGRTGVITPAAKLEPVPCGGVVISNASLHNYDEVNRLDVRIGDTVLIERAGDVIPKVVKVIASKRTGKERPVPVPKNCPACGTPLRRLEGEVAVRCLNLSCPVQIERSILHFVSRDAMDIDGMGEAVVRQLLKNPGLGDVADIYVIRKEELLKLDLFAEKRADNLLKAIAASKERPLHKLVYGLGIRQVGEKMAFVLADRFQRLDAIVSASEDDLLRVPDVGPVAAKSIREFFSLERVRETVAKLKARGVDPQAKRVEAKGASAFTGKTFVFTGELAAMSRADAEERVRLLGAKATGSVSKKTDFVVVGDNPGSKLEKAKSLGVRVLTEDAFLRELNKVS